VEGRVHPHVAPVGVAHGRRGRGEGDEGTDPVGRWRGGDSRLDHHRAIVSDGAVRPHPDGATGTPARVVDLFGALTHPCPRTDRLLQRAVEWRCKPGLADLRPLSSQDPKSKVRLADALGEPGVRRLIERFEGRAATKQQLADELGYSLSSVERLLRDHGVRRWTVRHTQGRAGQTT
jgi:hypothetical protein